MNHEKKQQIKEFAKVFCENLTVDIPDASVKRSANVVIREVWKNIGLFLMIYFIVMQLGKLPIFNTYDSTDAPNERSGLIILIDHRTLCEYLSTGKGGLTPRMNGTKGQIGCVNHD